MRRASARAPILPRFAVRFSHATVAGFSGIVYFRSGVVMRYTIATVRVFRKGGLDFAVYRCTLEGASTQG